VWALSAYMHTHTTGYATWVTLESRLHNSGADQSFSSVIQSGFILQSFILHSYFTHIFCLLSFISRSKSSLWTRNYQAYQDFFNFDGGGNRSARRKPPVRDPCQKYLLYGATYLVPRAGIEPTPHTDIGFRPVTQTRQTRREPRTVEVPSHWCFQGLCVCWPWCVQILVFIELPVDSINCQDFNVSLAVHHFVRNLLWRKCLGI
jgi:hypothetical protein